MNNPGQQEAGVKLPGDIVQLLTTYLTRLDT
jgi:hypothetical protein